MARPVARGAARRSREERGSALILALLVVLVLTTVGLGLAYFTTVEDRASGNAKLEKAAVYAAEVGLRAGEAAIGNAINSGIKIDQLLAQADLTAYANSAYAPPGGGLPSCPLTLGSTTYADMKVGYMPSLSTNNQAYYSLYVRNNAEDPGGAQKDSDALVNLISMGRIQTPAPPGITLPSIAESLGITKKKTSTGGIIKIIEEQLLTQIVGSQTGTQKGANAGGTNAGVV